MPDKIILEGISIPCALGVSAEERALRRPVRLDLSIECELRTSGVSDALEDTIDYQAIYDVVDKIVRGREHHLVEALGERVAAALFRDFAIDALDLTIRKPSPVVGSLAWAGVTLRRRRSDFGGPE